MIVLRLRLPQARAEGLGTVEFTTDPTRHASQRVIEAKGCVLFACFAKLAPRGGGEGLRYRIALI